MSLETKAKTLRQLNDICDDLAEVYCGTEFCVKQQQHLNQKYVSLEDAQKLEIELGYETEKRKAQTEATLNYAKMNKELEAELRHEIVVIHEKTGEIILTLDASLKRANMKLDSYVNTLEKGIITQLVKMTNTATNLQIQIAKANKIINEKCDRQLHCPWVCKTELREVLNSVPNLSFEYQKEGDKNEKETKPQP